MLRPPDIYYGVVTLAITAAAVTVFGPSLTEDTRYLFLAFSMTQAVWLGVWLAPWNRLPLRRVGYQCYYRFFGPYCTANITGVLQVDPNLSDAAVLDEVHRLTKDVWKDAKVEARLDNRVVIRSGGPSLTATVLMRHIDDDDDDDDDGDEQQEQVKQVSFQLGGFRGRIASTDDALRRYALFLLESLYADLRQQKTSANLVLKAALDDTNPFLTFYLRDVASSRPNAFHVTLRMDAPVASLDVTATSIIVTARTPATLVDVARHHLASPRLAYRD